MMVFCLPRSGSTAFCEKLAIENDIVNNKEYFNIKVRGFNPYMGTYTIGSLNKIKVSGKEVELKEANLKNNLPQNFLERIEILKNSPMDIDQYVVKILPHHVNWTSKELIDLFKNTKTYILNRRDSLRQFLSWYFANSTKSFHNRDSFGKGWRSHSALTNAYNEKFPDKINISQEWFDRFVGLFQRYLYGSLVIKDLFSDYEIVNYEDIHFPELLDNKKITIDYRDWVRNLDEVETFADQINRYKEKII